MAGQGKIPASQIKEKFVHFLESFNAHDDHEAISQDADRALPTYVRMARDMDTSQGTTLYINFEHVNEYDPQLADAIITHHLEYDEALRQAVQTMVAKYAPEKLENGDRKPHEFFCSFYNLAGIARGCRGGAPVVGAHRWLGRTAAIFTSTCLPSSTCLPCTPQQICFSLFRIQLKCPLNPLYNKSAP